MTEAVRSNARYQAVRMEVQEHGISTLIFNREEETFEKLFKTHFKSLYAYAHTIVKDEMMAEEMVQNVFFKIWNKKGRIISQPPVLSYLYKSVYHESLNYLKHQKVKAAYQAHTVFQMKDHTDNASKKIIVSELEQQINKALSELPEQCRTIFQMSRFEEMKYQEIAKKLGLSIKTIQNQMGKALKILRLKLADYLPLLIAFFIHH